MQYRQFPGKVVLCPRLPKAGVGYIAFRRDVTFVQANLRTFLCNVSLGGHNLGTFYTRKLKFGMLLTQTLASLL